MQLTFGEAYREFGVPAGLPPEAEAPLSIWHDMLVRWNKKTNLTRVTAPKQAVIYHLLDTLPLARAIAPRARVLDIGSGAGVPGVVIAILRPDVTVTCAESITKKAAFLIQVRGALQLTNLRVEPERAEGLAERFDLIAARAVADPKTLVSRFAHLTTPGGVVALFVTPHTKFSLPDGFFAAKTIDYTLPGGYGERRLVLAERPA